MSKARIIYEWVKDNNATQLQAAAHFGVAQGYISRALRSWIKRIGAERIDRRKKCPTFPD